MERIKNIDEALRYSWNLLFQGAVKRNNPMRTPVLGTTAEGEAHLRTIVLRKVNTMDRQLFFFTDRRSEKMKELQQQSKGSLLFWDPRKKVQLRCRGEFSWHQQDDIAMSNWEMLNVAGRKSYATTLAPGTPSSEDTAGLPVHWSDDMKLKDTAFAFENFTVLVQTVTFLEGLHLHEEGHQRFSFSWTDNRWEGSWLIP